MSLKSKVIKIIISVVVVLLIAKGFIAYVKPVSGVVIDSATKTPIPDIKLNRKVAVEVTLGPGGSSDLITRIDRSSTDKNGEFKFKPVLLLKIPLLSGLSSGYIRVNENLENKDYVYIDLWTLKINQLEQMKREDLRQLANNVYEIRLAPKVDNLEQCKGDSLCIEKNSFRLALKNRDENLCLNMEKGDKFKINQGECLEILAVAKQDEKICDMKSGYVNDWTTPTEECKRHFKPVEDRCKKEHENCIIVHTPGTAHAPDIEGRTPEEICKNEYPNCVSNLSRKNVIERLCKGSLGLGGGLEESRELSELCFDSFK